MRIGSLLFGFWGPGQPGLIRSGYRVFSGGKSGASESSIVSFDRARATGSTAKRQEWVMRERLSEPGYSLGHTVQGDGERELGAAIGLSTRSAGARNGRFAKLSAPPRSQEVDHLPIRLPGS